MDSINFLQWPAMAVTVVAAWLIASSHRGRRNTGFWAFLLSNGLWVVWGVYADAPALVALQVFLASLNIRGALKTGLGNQQPSENADASETARSVSAQRD